jgi:hypothetical protein
VSRDRFRSGAGVQFEGLGELGGTDFSGPEFRMTAPGGRHVTGRSTLAIILSSITCASEDTTPRWMRVPKATVHDMVKKSLCEHCHFHRHAFAFPFRRYDSLPHPSPSPSLSLSIPLSSSSPAAPPLTPLSHSSPVTAASRPLPPASGLDTVHV